MSVVSAINKKISSTVRGFAVYLLLTVVYIIFGKLGLMLALPPGYVSAIFPPAGVAVAAAFIGRRKALPWIFLGSMLLNTWAGYSANHHIDVLSLTVAAVIAIASTLQAALGGYALRRAVGYPACFDRASDVLWFLLLAPLICLTSASLSVGGLLALGIVTPATFPLAWVTWWIGDTLGVMVVFPLVLIAAGEPRELWRRRIATVALPMLLIFTLFVAIFLKTNQWEYSDSLSDFRLLSQQAENQVRNKLEEQESLLEQTAGLFVHDAHGIVTRDEFHRFMQKSLKRYPMIQAVEWADEVEASHRINFEAIQRKDSPGFEIRELNSAGRLTRAGQRSSYYPVTYVEPLVGNESAVGFDLASNAQRLETLNKAKQNGTVAASAAVTLVQERQQQVGVLLLLAINRHDSKSGIVLSVLRMNDFMDKLLLNTRPMLYTRLIDLDEHRLIYDNFGQPAPQTLYEHTFSFGSRQYRLETAPTPAYFAQHHGWQSWGVLGIGVLGTGLLGALLLLGTGHTSRIEAQVKSRTKELLESEQHFSQLFILVPIPLGLVSRNGAIVHFNDCFIKTFGYDINDIPTLTALWKHACPDASYRQWAMNSWSAAVTTAENTGRNFEPAEYHLTCKNGAQRIVLIGGSIIGEHILATFIDITERVQGEQALKLEVQKNLTLSQYDLLTRVPNRMLFSDRLQQALVAAKRHKTHLALMFVDLDKFKQINDQFGHAVGDLLLKEAANRIQQCLRASDTVARIGGDEFLVLLSAIDAEQDALLVAEKIRFALNQPFALIDKNLNISCSIGIAVYPTDGTDEMQLTRNADVAMYHAKNAGRNAVMLYQEDMRQQLHEPEPAAQRSGNGL